MKLNKSISLLILAVFLFSLLGSFVLAAERGLEVEYPKVGEEEITATTTLPEYIKYIFKFSLIIAAVAAFAILIYGGFRYLTSAGAPEVMKEAKSWIYGGILGLVLLLCSYLILTTINPELLSPKEPEVKPVTGIYLINAEGKKLYYIQSTPEIPKDFSPERIVFISDKPADPDFADPNKLELDSVFVYPEKNWEGNPTKITNDGAWTTSSDSTISSLKSFKFLWHRPGIYLYKEETGWGTDSWPLFLQSSSRYVGKDWNDQVKSISFVNTDGAEFNYDSVLFQHVDFEGRCDWINFNQPSLPESVKNDLSAIAIFRSVEPSKGVGEVIFYDDQNCEGNKYIWTWEKEGSQVIFFSAETFEGTDPPKVLANNVESFRINGNFAVVLITSEELMDGKGDCKYFPVKGCQSSLKGTSVYCALPVWLGGCRPQAAFIFTTIE